MDFVDFHETIRNLTTKYNDNNKRIRKYEKINNEFRQKIVTVRDKNVELLDQINKTSNNINDISEKIGEKQWAQKRASLADFLEETKMNFQLQQMKEHQDFLTNNILKNDYECLDTEKAGRQMKVDAETAKLKKDELFAQLSSLVNLQSDREERLAQLKAECEITKKRNAARLLRLRKSLQEVEVCRRRVRADFELLQSSNNNVYH